MPQRNQKPSDEPAQPGVLVALPADLAGRWYVAHTRARNEKLLAKELTRLSIFNYLPLAGRETRSPATRRISRSMVPVFPGYVFFNGQEEQRYLALRTNRIAHVLEVADQEQLVAELRHVQLLLSRDHEFFVMPRIQVGSWGRITAGALAGLEGVVTRWLGRFRLTMNVTILGQSVNVEVDGHNVEAIDPPAYAAEYHDSRVRIR